MMKFLYFWSSYVRILINAQKIEVLTIERKHSWRKCVKDNCCFLWVWCLFLRQKFQITALPTGSSATSWVSSFQKRIWSANTDRYFLHNPGWDSGGTSHRDTELKGCLLRQEGYADYADCVPGLFLLAGAFGVVLIYPGTNGEWFLEDQRLCRKHIIFSFYTISNISSCVTLISKDRSFQEMQGCYHWEGQHTRNLLELRSLNMPITWIQRTLALKNIKSGDLFLFLFVSYF